MTQGFLVGLAALLIDLREWLEAERPGCLDAGLVDAVIDVCAAEHRRLMEPAK